MTALLGDRSLPFRDSTSVESESDGWLLLRLTVRSVAVLGLLAALLVAFIHAFIHLCFRTTRD